MEKHLFEKKLGENVIAYNRGNDPPKIFNLILCLQILPLGQFS